MCSPTLVFTVATTAFSYMAKKKAANEQEAALLENQRILLQDSEEKSVEIDGSAAAEKSDIAIEALRAKGTMRVASGENLGMGLTSQLLLQDVYAQEGRDVTKVEVNRQRSQKQNERDKRGIRSRTQSSINTIKRPSLIGTGLQIAGQVAGGTGGKKSTTSSASSSSGTPFFLTPQGGNR